MHREIGIAIAAGLASAMIMVLPAYAVPFALLAPFFPLPLLLCGLARGATTGAIALCVFGLAMAVLSPAASVLPLVAIYGLPALLVVWLALQQKADADGQVSFAPPGHVVSSLAIYCVAGFLAAVVFSGGPQAILDFLRSFTDGFMSAFGQALDTQGATMQPEDVAKMSETLAATLPAAAIVYTSLMYLVNAVFAQSILAKRNLAIRPTPVYRTFWLPSWLLIAFGASLAGWLLLDGTAGFILLTVTAALALPFFLQGLAVMHVLTRGLPGRGLWLFLFYLLLVLITGVSVVLVTALGVVDHLTGLRARASASRPSDEE